SPSAGPNARICSSVTVEPPLRLPLVYLLADLWPVSPLRCSTNSAPPANVRAEGIVLLLPSTGSVCPVMGYDEYTPLACRHYSVQRRTPCPPHPLPTAAKLSASRPSSRSTSCGSPQA